MFFCFVFFSAGGQGLGVRGGEDGSFGWDVVSD